MEVYDDVNVDLDGADCKNSVLFHTSLQWRICAFIDIYFMSSFAFVYRKGGQATMGMDK